MGRQTHAVATKLQKINVNIMKQATKCSWWWTCYPVMFSWFHHHWKICIWHRNTSMVLLYFNWLWKNIMKRKVLDDSRIRFITFSGPLGNTTWQENSGNRRRAFRVIPSMILANIRISSLFMCTQLGHYKWMITKHFPGCLLLCMVGGGGDLINMLCSAVLFSGEKMCIANLKKVLICVYPEKKWLRVRKFTLE